MRTLIALTCLALAGGVATPRELHASRGDEFVRDFRVSHYVELAMTFQALAPRERAAQLRALASNPLRSHEVFPLCRMLFEATDRGVFRRPLLGGPAFVVGTYQDWPLEPITVVDGFPFLIVRGYSLAGKAESAGQYVAYCLANCRWTQRQYAAATTARIVEALERLLAAHPALRIHADWLKRQAT